MVSRTACDPLLRRNCVRRVRALLPEAFSSWRTGSVKERANEKRRHSSEPSNPFVAYRGYLRSVVRQRGRSPNTALASTCRTTRSSAGLSHQTLSAAHCRGSSIHSITDKAITTAIHTPYTSRHHSRAIAKPRSIASQGLRCLSLTDRRSRFMRASREQEVNREQRP